MIVMSFNRHCVARLFSLTAALALIPAIPVQAACEDSAVALQVLGSGGPFGHGRASSGYLVWINGVAKIMVDAGGGTFTRFHEADAEVGELELLALSHFHPDHSSEVPALLWIQPTDLKLSGPTGSDSYPSVDEYVSGLFGPRGVFRAVTDGKGLQTVSVDVSQSEPTEVFANDSISVRALGVPHGIVPAIGYRIDIGNTSIAFSSDQNGSDPAFVDFVTDVDVLVVHLAIPESATGNVSALHAKPSVWGQMAADANVGTLVLSHLSAAAPLEAGANLDSLDASLAHLRSRYDGPLVIAEDLMCVPVESKQARIPKPAPGYRR